MYSNDFGALGVSFQPGQQPTQGPNAGSNQGSGVQEAIKILSLRLPKVLGAQAAVPMPLLTSQGSGGDSRVDSVVNQVLRRLPQLQATPMPMQPAMGPSGPAFSGLAAPAYQSPEPWSHQQPRSLTGKPRISMYEPPTTPTPEQPSDILSPAPVKDYWSLPTPPVQPEETYPI